MTRSDDFLRGSLNIRQGLDAHVKQVVTVRDGKRIAVVLKIIAHNRTNKTIVLNEPYRLRVGQASNVTAFDVLNRRALTARHNPGNKQLEVHFEENRQLRPGEQIIWRVSFTSNRFRVLKGREDSDCSIGIFVLDPLEQYQDVLIINHRVDLRFRFLEIRDGKLCKRPIVDQENNQDVCVVPVERSGALELIFDSFDLSQDQKMKAIFRYRFTQASKARAFWSGYGVPALSKAAKIGLAILPVFLKALMNRRFHDQ